MDALTAQNLALYVELYARLSFNRLKALDCRYRVSIPLFDAKFLASSLIDVSGTLDWFDLRFQ